MKFLLTLLTFCTVTLSLSAENVRSFDDALLRSSGKKPVVLLCYGANYDQVSAQKVQELKKDRKMTQLLRHCVVLEVPVYQLPNEKEQKEWKKIMGKHSLPAGIWSYPCLAVLDSRGHLRGVVQSAAELETPETAAAALATLLDAYDDQEKLLHGAVKASEGKRLGLLAQAADVPAILPADIAAPGFDPVQVVEALQPMSHEEANNYIRNLISSGYYSRRQRQEIMAAYAGHLRRNGASANRLRAVYTEMRNIDPSSIYGAYAEGAIALWVTPKEEDPSKDTPYKTLAQREAEQKKSAQSADASTPDDDGWTPMGSTKNPAETTKDSTPNAAPDDDDGWTPMGSTKKPGK